MTHRIRRHPLAYMYGAVLALFLVFWWLPPHIKRYTDLGLSLVLMVAFLWAMALMLRRTRVWTHRGMGFLGTISGDAMLYGSVFLGIAFGWRWHLVDLARSFFVVGAALLIWGLLRTTRHERKGGGLTP